MAKRLGRGCRPVIPAAGPRRCRFGAACGSEPPRGCEPGSRGHAGMPECRNAGMPECREYDAAVIEEPIVAKHDLRFVTFSGTAASVAFVLLAIVTTQV